MTTEIKRNSLTEHLILELVHHGGASAKALATRVIAPHASGTTARKWLKPAIQAGYVEQVSRSGSALYFVTEKGEQAFK